MANTNIPNLSKPKSIVSAKKTQDTPPPASKPSANPLSSKVPKLGINSTSNVSAMKPIQAIASAVSSAKPATVVTQKQSVPVTPSKQKSVLDQVGAVGDIFGSKVIDAVGDDAEFFGSIANVAINDAKATLSGNFSKTGQGALDPTLGFSKPTDNFGTSQEVAAKKAETTASARELKNQRSAYVYDVFSGKENGALTSGINSVENWRKTNSDALTTKADLANQPGYVQTAANIAGSIPFMATASIPNGIGLLLNYGTMSMDAIRSKSEELSSSSATPTNSQKASVMTYAGGSALLQSALYSIAPPGKGVSGIAKISIGNTIKQFTKALAKNEVTLLAQQDLVYIGTGIIAKQTTNPGLPLFGNDSDGALISLSGLAQTSKDALIMGGVFAGIGLIFSGAKKGISSIGNFKNTKKVAETIIDKPVSEITPEDKTNFSEALKEDLKDPKNVKAVNVQTSDSLSSKEVSMPINDQISMYQHILVKLYDDVLNNKDAAQEKKYSDYVYTINQKINELKDQKTIIDTRGNKYSVSQIETFKKSYDDQVKFYKEEMSSAKSPKVKASIKEDLDFAIDASKELKRLLDTQSSPKTSQELLDELKVSRSPVNETFANNDKSTVSNSNQANLANTQTNKDMFLNVPTSSKLEVTQKEYEDISRHVSSSKEDVQKIVNDYANKYKTIEDAEKAVTNIKLSAISISKLSEDIRSGKIIKMKLQLFALKKVLNNLSGISSDNPIHGFIDSFRKILQDGSPDDMSKFIKDNMSVEQLTYERISNRSAIELSDKNVASGGEKYQEALYAEFVNSAKDTILPPDKLVSLSKYLVELTKSDNVDAVAKGFDGLAELSDRFTKAGQFTQSARAVLDLMTDRHAKVLEKDLDKRSSDPIDKAIIKNSVKNTKDIAGKATEDAVEGAIKGFEDGLDAQSAKSIDEIATSKKKKASMDDILSVLIKKDIAGHEEKKRSADSIALQVLHNIYLELNPGSKGKETNIFNTLSIMATNKEKYGEAWDKAKPKVEELIAKENIKRSEKGLPELAVPENYLERYSNPDFTKAMMNQAIRQVLNYNRTDMKTEARKFYLEGGTGENTINRFVTGLRDKFDDAYGQKMPEETFNYLKEHFVKQFKQSLESSRDSISSQMRKQVESTSGKNIISKKSRIEKTIEQLTDSVISGALSDDKLSSIWANRLGLNYISDEMRAQISKSIIEIDKIADENAKFHAYQDFVDKLGNQIRATNIQKFNAWRRFAMLCNPKTWTRNGASNYAYLPYTKVMDGVTYRIQKSIGLETQYSPRGENYLKRGSNKEIDAVVDSMITPAKLRTIMEEGGKYTLGEHLKREGRIFQSDKLEAITKAPLKIISTGTLTKNGKHGIAFFGDQGILTTYVTSALRNKLNALGYKESLPESTKLEMQATALKYAKEVALTRTYRSASVISEFLTGMKTNVNTDAQIKSLIKSGTLEDLAKAKLRRSQLNARNTAVDLAIPFIVTPSAIATEGYRLSPVALAVSTGKLIGMKIKGEINANPYETARVTKQISQALVGTAGQWTLGAALALTGAITGAPPDTDKEKKEWALEGKTAYSINIPGLGWMSYSWCQPVALGIMGGADIATVIKNGGYAPAAIPAALTASFDGVVGATLYGNVVSNLFGGTTLSQNVTNFATGSVTQLFPTISKALATSIDPYVRNTYSGNTAQALLYRVLSYVPIASMLQPVKIDIWGNPVKNPDAGANIAGRTVLNLLSPFTLNKENTDVVSQEVIRLYNSTGSSAALPVAVSTKWSKVVNKKTYSYNLSGQDYVDYQILMGQFSFNYANTVISDPRYTSGSDEYKLKVLKKVYAKASEDAKLEYIKTHR